MPLKLRPFWQRPFIRFANWWQYGHTEAMFGDHVIPRYSPPRCTWCFEPINGHYHERDGQRFYDTGEVVATNGKVIDS